MFLHRAVEDPHAGLDGMPSIGDFRIYVRLLSEKTARLSNGEREQDFSLPPCTHPLSSLSPIVKCPDCSIPISPLHSHSHLPSL